MKLFAFILIFSSLAKADLTSPFPSTVSGLSIPNSHYLESNKNVSVIRGMAPQSSTELGTSPSIPRPSLDAMFNFNRGLSPTAESAFQIDGQMLD